MKADKSRNKTTHTKKEKISKTESKEDPTNPTPSRKQMKKKADESTKNTSRIVSVRSPTHMKKEKIYKTVERGSNQSYPKSPFCFRLTAYLRDVA